jgi:hypothetical protein
MRIIAFVTDRPAIHSILSYLGEPTAPPELAPARGPPLWEQATQLHWDDIPAPAPSVRVRPAGELVGLVHLISEFVAGPGPGLTVDLLPRRSQNRHRWRPPTSVG